MQLEFDFDEQWKPIEGYEGIYDISNKGQIYSHPRQKTKGNYSWGYEDAKGYLKTTLSIKNKQKTKYIHRLVWETFVGSIPKGYDVHHINHNRQDNRVENLCLVEHSKHSEMHYEEKKEKVINGMVNSRSKPVLQYTIDGEFVTEYKSQSDASRETGILTSNICNCSRGKIKTAGGFIWKCKKNIA